MSFGPIDLSLISSQIYSPPHPHNLCPFLSFVFVQLSNPSLHLSRGISEAGQGFDACWCCISGLLFLLWLTIPVWCHRCQARMDRLCGLPGFTSFYGTGSHHIALVVLDGIYCVDQDGHHVWIKNSRNFYNFSPESSINYWSFKSIFSNLYVLMEFL